MLTAEQKRYFETFGFLVLRQHLSARDVELMRDESTRILTENRGGKPFRGDRRQAMIPFFEHSPTLAELMADDRIYCLGEDLLGPDFLLNASEGNLHVGDTQWHGGGPVEEPLPHIKIAFYLETTTRETGALRILPGSHTGEFARRLQPLNQQNHDPTVMPFGLGGADLPCTVIESEPGDVVVFSESTWHAAFGGAAGRSQHAVSFMANPRTDEQLAFLLDLCRKYLFSLHPPPAIVDSQNPRLRRMVSRLVELGVGPPDPTPMFEC